MLNGQHILLVPWLGVLLAGGCVDRPEDEVPGAGARPPAPAAMRRLAAPLPPYRLDAFGQGNLRFEIGPTGEAHVPLHTRLLVRAGASEQLILATPLALPHKGLTLTKTLPIGLAVDSATALPSTPKEIAVNFEVRTADGREYRQVETWRFAYPELVLREVDAL